MAFFRNLSLVIILIITLVFILLLIPVSHAWLLSKATAFFLEVPAKFDLPKMDFDTYRIRGRLGSDAQIMLQADYTTLKEANLSLDYVGDVTLFSKIAKTELPHIAIELNATLDRAALKTHAKLLDGALDAALDLNALTYHAKAKRVSLLSFQRQQQIEPYLDGALRLDSHGDLSDIPDIDLTLKSSDMHLLPSTLAYLGTKQKSAAPAALDATLTLQDKKVALGLHLDSTVGSLDVQHLKYALDDGRFDARLDLHNRLKAYAPLQALKVSTQGRYFRERLLADVSLDADGYRLDLDDIDLEEGRLRARYALHSAVQEFVDITPDHQIYGDLIHTSEGSEANITSRLLGDIITLKYDNSSLKVTTDTLSLAGLLRHLRQRPMASATVALAADVDLKTPLRWKSSLTTTDLLLDQRLSDALGHHDPITLKVTAYDPDDRHIIIKPRLESSMMRLDKSSILYDMNDSSLKITGAFKDLNISYYHAPSLSLQSQIDLTEPLQVKATIKSPFEKIDLRLSQEKERRKGLIDFDFKDIDRLQPLQTLQSLSGSIDFDTIKDRHHFIAHLRDINSTFYDTPFADINGTIDQGEKLTGTFKLLTPYERIRLDLTHEDKLSDAWFSYDITRLDRFASLRPDYSLDGSGQFSYDKKLMKLDIDSTQFGPIKISKNKQTIDLLAEKLPIQELFRLTDRKAPVDGMLSMKAKMTPTHMGALISSRRIRPTDTNASFRPTSLLAKLALDGDLERYDGTLDIKTEHERLHMDDLGLSVSSATLKSDLLLTSDDLALGTPILPDILVGPTRFTGTLDYDKTLRLHLKNKKISLSEQTHQSLDENATGTLDMRLKTDLIYDGTQADIDIFAASPYFTLKPFKTHLDLNDSRLSTKLHLATDLWQKDSDIALTMHLKQPLGINGTIKTAYETLSLEHLLLDTDTKSIEGTYRLTLKQTDQKASIRHGAAAFYGHLSSDPTQQATLQSDSFGGEIQLIATPQEVSVQSEAVRLDKVMKFLAMDSALKSGLLDADAKFHSDDFLKSDLSTIKGDISIDATDLLLEGIDVDKNIEMLKNYQDISLFEGNFPGKGIMTSIVKAPVSLLTKKKIQRSHISRVHADSYIDAGRLYCYDCAVKTKKNRIAVKGAIDLNTTDFHYFQVGLLQKDGCAFFVQDIKGSIEDPKVELTKTSLALVTGTIKSVGGVVESSVGLGTKVISKTGGLAGDIIDTTTGFIPVVNKATGAVSGTVRSVADAPGEVDEMLSRKCIPFYRGIVRHPE